MSQTRLLMEQLRWSLVRHVSGLYFELKSIVTDFLSDSRLGIETMGWVNIEDKSLFNDSSNYLPTKYSILEETLKHIKFKDDDVLVDIGCGKGRVICFFSFQKIKKIIGIELNEEMCKAAISNVSRLKISETAIEILNGDAATIDLSEGTVFFMYDPFGLKTLEKVLNTIEESLASSPREITIVYCYPRFTSAMYKKEWLKSHNRVRLRFQPLFISSTSEKV